MQPTIAEAFIIRIAYNNKEEVEEIKNTSGYSFIGEYMIIGLLDGKTYLNRALADIRYWEKVQQPITNPDKKINVVNEDKKK